MNHKGSKLKEKGRKMELNIIAKGESFDLKVASKRADPDKFYFGAGWDTKNGTAVDLDIVAVLLRNGKLTKQSDYIYFENRFATGVSLSKDNTTGEGEGDDESIVINTKELDADVDAIIIGLVAYAGADLSCAPDTHFRVCDGDNEKSEQIADIKFNDTTFVGDTGIVAFKLVRTATGFILENKSELLQIGQGVSAIKAFGARFQA